MAAAKPIGHAGLPELTGDVENVKQTKQGKEDLDPKLKPGTTVKMPHGFRVNR